MHARMDFDGRVVIVTGAGAGMGRSHATLLAARGARVVVNDIRNAAEVVGEIWADGGHAVADEHDIAAEGGAQAVVRSALDAFGRIDAVVNNAGISGRCSFPEISWELFDRTMKVNAYAAFFLTQEAWPHLIESGSGRVVMIASKSAVFGGLPDLAHYGTSKGAMLAMTRRIASEGVGHGIGVNAVLPTALTTMMKKDSADGSAPSPAALSFAERLGVDPTDTSALADRTTAVVSAVVAWLCHPSCTVNGEFINAVAGDVSRVSFAMGTGIADPQLTPESVAAHAEAILDMTGASVLPAMRDAGGNPLRGLSVSRGSS